MLVICVLLVEVHIGVFMIEVVVTTLDAGYPVESEEVKKLGWSLGDKFEVEKIDVGLSSSTVELKGLGKFNTVFFKFLEDGVEFNIYKDHRFWSFYRHV